MNNVVLTGNGQFVREPIEKFFDLQVEESVKEIDFVLQVPHIYIDSEKILLLDDLYYLLNKCNVLINTLTPIAYRYSICSERNSYQREKTVLYYKNVIDFASKVKAKHVLITGTNALYDMNKEVLISNAISTLKELSDYAKEKKVLLLLGTVLGEESINNASTPVITKLRDLKYILDQVDNQNLNAYLDLEVISACGETIDMWFKELEDKIKFVRFTDGNYNGYRILGKGVLPLKKYLEELKEFGYTGPLSLNIPGERYVEDPYSYEKESLKVMRDLLMEV